MKKIHLVLIILFFCINENYSNAQEKYFETQYAWDFIQNGRRILPNNQNNYVISGQAKDSILYDWYSYSIEIDKYGNNYPVNRHLSLEPNYNGSMREMIKTEDGFFIAGAANDPNIQGSARAYYIMTNEQGIAFQADTVGNDEILNIMYSCCRTFDSGYFLGGEIYTGGGEPGIFPYLVKLNAQGDQEWDKVYDNYQGRGLIYDFIPAPDSSGYYILGTVGGSFFNSTGDVLLAKIDEMGTAIWDTVYDWGSNENAGKFILRKEGGFLVFGSQKVNNGDIYSVILFFDENGHLTHTPIDDYYFNHFIESVVQLPDSSYVFSGNNNPDNNTDDLNAQILKLDKDGNFMWRRQYGGEDNDYGYDIIEALDGGFVMCGRTESNTDGADVYVVKMNCMGLLTEPQAAFDYEIEDGFVSFLNESLYVYPDSIDGGFFVWDFDDNSEVIMTENYETITHEYVQAGQYTVTLKGIVCTDTSIIKKTYCIGTQNATADFSFTNEDIGLYSFSPTESYHDAAFLWHFGDSTTSNEQFPTHQFAQNGHYNISLSLILCNDTSVYTQDILVDGVGISENNNLLANQIHLFPNPASDFLQIETDIFHQNDKTTMSVFNVLGEKVLEQGFTNEINISALPIGSYFLQFKNEGDTVVKRFTKQ
ncbi:MAG: PKD domain-containing protein [Chitinophagales bacterium]